MSDKRQKNQLVLALLRRGGVKLRRLLGEGTESFTAKCETERPASHEQLMEQSASGETAGRLTSESKRTKEVRESTA